MGAINPIVRGDFPSAQDKALYLGILQEPSGLLNERNKLFTMKTSNQAQEKVARFSGWGVFDTKPVGGPARPDHAGEMYSKIIRHTTYGKRADIVMEALQDDPKGIVKDIWRMGRELRGVMEYTLETLHWSYLNSRWSSTASGSFYTMNSVDYPLFSLTHPTAIPGVTYRNRFTNAVQLNRATLEAAITQSMQNMVNPRAMLQMNPMATLIVGIQDMPTALRLIANMGVPESADNGPNIIARYIKRVVATPLFSSDGRWAIAADKDKLGLISFLRMGLEVQTLAQNSTLNSTRVAAFRVGFGGIMPDGFFGSIPA